MGSLLLPFLIHDVIPHILITNVVVTTAGVDVVIVGHGGDIEWGCLGHMLAVHSLHRAPTYPDLTVSGGFDSATYALR